MTNSGGGRRQDTAGIRKPINIGNTKVFERHWVHTPFPLI
jgi:hypothetical protein